jgi:hypothetical protein
MVHRAYWFCLENILNLGHLRTDSDWDNIWQVKAYLKIENWYDVFVEMCYHIRVGFVWVDLWTLLVVQAGMSFTLWHFLKRKITTFQCRYDKQILENKVVWIKKGQQCDLGVKSTFKQKIY